MLVPLVLCAKFYKWNKINGILHYVMNGNDCDMYLLSILRFYDVLSKMHFNL